MNPLDVVETKQALASMAELLVGYFTALRGYGLSRKEAFTVVLEWQRIMLGQKPEGQ